MRHFLAVLLVVSCFSLMVPLKSDGQSLSVGYSPTSVELWGNTEHAQSIKIEYFHNVFQKNKFNVSFGARFQTINIANRLEYSKSIKVEVSTNHNPHAKNYDIPPQLVEKEYTFVGYYRSVFFITKTSFDDLFYNIGVSHSFGVGYFFRKYPDNISGTNLHFSTSQEVFKKIGDHLIFGIEYSHISNGNRGDVNFGIDNISTKITWRF